MQLKSFYLRCWEWEENIVMLAFSVQEIGYLEDHFIESVTENWHYFRFSTWPLLRLVLSNSLIKYSRKKMWTWRNVYLLKIKAKCFRDGTKDI